MVNNFISFIYVNIYIYIFFIYKDNIVKDNIPKITNCLSKNVILNKSLNNLNIDILRNYNSGNLGITQNTVKNNNLNSNNIKLLRNTYSTNTNLLALKYLKNNNNILLNGKGLNIKEEKSLNNDKILNKAINAIIFSSSNKRFMSTINEINQPSENKENLNNCNNEQFQTNLKENEKINSDSKKENKEGPNFTFKQETKNEKNEKNLISLIKKYGIVAIIVHGTLSCIIYFTTLGIVLYYDIDPDELTKQTKLYISKMTKKLLGKGDDNNNIALKDIIHHNTTKKQDPSNSEKEDEPTDKKKRLLKTMMMTYAAVHVFSPVKTMLTLTITPYMAKLLKKTV